MEEDVRIIAPCAKCFEDEPDQANVNPANKFASILYREDNCYQFTCPKGHMNEYSLQNQKYEQLADVGLNAIFDDYYRESVSAFTSSMERFHEFSLRAIMLRASKQGDLLKSCWKEVKTTERQLGAFVFLWGYFFGECPKVTSDKDAKFRNNVIHNGYFPTRDEALAYGNIIVTILRSQVVKIHNKFSEEIRIITDENRKHLVQPLIGQSPIVALMNHTILNVMEGDDASDENYIEKHLVGIANVRKHMGLLCFNM
jgi:hypothetical protein